jgi:hypothetical protein
MHHHSTKITLIIISLLSLAEILLCQSTTYFIHREPKNSRETIRFLWNKGQVYTYTKASTTLKIEGSDTLTNTSEVDTITFKILK